MSTDLTLPAEGELMDVPESRIVTPAQAKIEAVAELERTAYARASLLGEKLTPDESKALLEDFPDHAFRPGAAGKENLIYLEHPYLRWRLTSVLGIGSWSLICRALWKEDYSYFDNKGKECFATRVYADCFLVVRGCLAGEGIGSMDYFHNNPAVTYGDAVEGAKSQALRLACKALGIGLQPWLKGFGDQWRKRANKIDDAQAGIIEQLLLDSNADVPKFLDCFKIAKVRDLPKSKYENARGLLDRKIKEQLAGRAKAAAKGGAA